MRDHAKLKANNLMITLTVLGATAAIIIIVLLKMNYDEQTFNQVAGVWWTIVAFIQLIVWLRTKNPGYMVWLLACIALAASYITDYKGLYFFIPASGLILAYLYLLATHRMTWRYRDILELAAKPINETADGFTPRPFPAGKASFTKEEMAQFGKYLAKNLIAFPFIENEKVLLVINSSGRSLFLKPKIEKVTFISFDDQGNVAVNIAKKDYKKYKEELSFDKLCESLANLFKTFLHLYQTGKKDQINIIIKRDLDNTNHEVNIQDF